MVRKILFGTLTAVFIVTLFWGISENGRANNLAIVTENVYRRSFTDFVANMDSLENSLSKSQAASSATQQVLFLSQSWQESETVVKDLSHLPAEEIGISYLEQFLNEINEYTHYLTKQTVAGNKIQTQEEEILIQMHEQLISVNRDIQELYLRLNTENLAWVNKASTQKWQIGSKIISAIAQGDENNSQEKIDSVRSGLEQLDTSLQKLPPYNYEGQTDTHSVPEPLGLTDSIATEEEAKKTASNFLDSLGYTNIDLQAIGSSNGPFGGYIFEHNTAVIDVSKQGNIVTLFRDERPIGICELNTEETKIKLLETLKNLGWEDFIISSSEDFGAYLQLEAVNVIQGVCIYPDKLRIRVAKDNGQIISYDSTSYWAYHHDRDFSKKLTLEQAKNKLLPKLNIKESRLVIISKPGSDESLCYEFRTNIKDEEYLICINALDGTEEKVLRIIKTARGEYLQ